ncbi:MAG TPA: UPF0182 family protein [Candidatus Solibacter sp.]|jgi:uncharacterized membrane protein (UPF0182 family)|nr:UPF0182 family protein [Candidatus Solibacter sp.]
MQFRRGGDLFDNIEPLFGGRGPRRPDFGNFKLTPGTRRILYVAAFILLVLLVFNPLIGLYVDNLWFKSLNFQSIFTTRIAYQAWLFLAGFLVAFVVLALNGLFAVRLMGPTRLSQIGVKRRVLSSGLGRAVLGIAAVIAFFMGEIISGAWQEVALALNATSFGRTDPVFGQDVGYYVFQLPYLRTVLAWALALVIISLVGAALVYVSGITPGGQLELPPGAVGHASILASAFFLLLAAHYRLAMFGLLNAHNGSVFGAGATDLSVRLPVYWLLLVVCLLLAVLLLANIVLARSTLLLAAPALWLILVAVLLGLAPGVYQAVAVKPNELNREHDYLQRQIDNTNQAFALDRVTFKDFTDKQTITPDLLDANAGTVGNLRLWDYSPLQQAYGQIQTIRQFYDFHDVDIDRYILPDGYRQVMISARELSPDKLPASAKSWVNIHLKYTHGYGASATPVSKVAAEGLPDLSPLRDIPPVGDLKLTVPQIYFGETTTGYVVAASKEPEVDFEKQDTQQYSKWTGTNGIAVGGGLRRLALAYSQGDPNLILSGQVTSDSQLLIRRDVQTRIQTLAPFLTLDKDPYVVVNNGRLSWIQDAYTTASDYPYSEPATLSPDIPDVNYVRNSVKVVMDAYDGSVQMYIADSSDPIIQTYTKIFPGVFRPLSDMPSELRAHIRYPEQFFQVQAAVLENYHMHDPQTFFGRADAWVQASETTTQGGVAQTLQPYYVMMRLPGMDHEEFILIQPFTPLNKSNMVAWMAARSDGSEYGKLLTFRFPTGRQIVGPGQVESRILQNPAISRDYSLLNQNGSRVILGNLLVIPINDAILYVQPFYLASSSSTGIPELKKVIVADETSVGYADTLGDALAQLTGGVVATAPPGGGTTTPPTTTQKALIAQANALYADAQAKLKAGDFTGYANDIQQLGAILQQLNSGSSPTASPSPGPSPSPSR